MPIGDFNGDTLYTFRSNSVASSHSEDHEELPLLQLSSPPLAENPTTPSPPSPPLVILTLTTSLSQLEIPDDVDSVQALTPRSGQTDGSPAEPLSPQPSDSVSPRLSTSLSPLALVDNLVRLPTPLPVVIIAESAYRSVFPAPVKYGLPGLFVGDNITDFLEAYEEACRDLRVTADDDKADRFGRWCERDIRKVIQRFDAADLATWTTLKAKIKKRWAIRDPDQKGDHRALDKLFNKPCDTSAESIFQQLEEVEKLLARVPSANYIRKRQEAVDRIWENFSVHVQNGFLIQLKDMNTEPKDMDFDDFRDWVQNSLYNGISAGPRFLKVYLKDNRVPAATRRRRESLVTLLVPLSELACELAIATVSAPAPKASKPAPDQVDEMT